MAAAIAGRWQVEEEFLIENTTPAPNGSRHAGRSACLDVWQPLAASQDTSFDVEEVEVYGERSVIFWRFRRGKDEEQSVRGVNPMRVRDGQIVAARGYVKGAQPPQPDPGGTMKRTGTATWAGTLSRGSGQLSTQSRALTETPISVSTRFGNEVGTNAEELIAAAHASCYAMTLTYILGNADTPPERIETEAEVTVERDGSGWTVTGIHLRVGAEVPGASTAAVQEAAQQAKAGCLVSRLVNVPITLDLLVPSPSEAEGRVDTGPTAGRSRHSGTGPVGLITVHVIA